MIRRFLVSSLALLLPHCSDRCIEVAWHYDGDVGDRKVCARISKPDDRAADHRLLAIYERAIDPADPTVAFCQAQGNDEPGYLANVWINKDPSLDCFTPVLGGTEQSLAEALGISTFTFLREGVTQVDVELLPLPKVNR